MKIHESLRPYVEAAQAAGLTVRTPGARVWYQTAGHVFVTREGQPGMAMIQVSSFPAFEPPSIDVPVKPNPIFGSSVMQDYDGTPAGAVALLEALVAQETVKPRFVGDYAPVRVDLRIPADAEPVTY